MTDVVEFDRADGIAIVSINNPPVNAISHAVREGLLQTFAALKEDKSIRCVVLFGQGKEFIAGADIKEFGKPIEPPLLPHVCSVIEKMPVPVVASLHGASLGGGLEIALASHFRVAYRQAVFGLPEVTLGLIPGAGGTQRLPRLVGTQSALDMIVSGKRVAAQHALELGLVDEIHDGEPQSAGVSFARTLVSGQSGPRRTSEMPKSVPLNWTDAHKRVVKKARGQIAPLQAFEAVRISTEKEFDAGVRSERKLFEDLMVSDQRKALVHAFFAERSAPKQPDLDGVSPRAFRNIGVYGCGTMGAGIATCALMAGLNVTVIEQSEDNLAAARNRIAEALSKAVEKGKISRRDADRMLDDRLLVSANDGALAASDVVIEAVFEDLDVKRSVFERLDQVCKSDAVLATNTSYLDVNTVAERTSRAGNVIGLHFFSPAHVMKLLEVVVPDAATASTVATGFALARTLGKTAVRSGVCEGFIGNRILNACRTVADHMVLDGASPFEIDEAMVEFGYPLGPFQVADLAGLDIGWAMRKRRAANRKPHERVGRYADLLCEAGHFGRKTGTGFYRYGATPEVVMPNEDVMRFIREERIDRAMKERVFNAHEIRRRYMAAMVNEAARILGEGIARRPLDIDVVLMSGYAFPRHLGGPCKWADMTGLADLLNQITELGQEDRHFWSPAPLLKDLVDQGSTFDDLNV